MAEWDALENAMSGLGDAAVAIPFAGMRADAGVALTMAKYVPPLFKALGNGPRGAEGFEDAKYLRENFSVLVDEHVKNPWLRGLLDLECFVISGLKADATSAAIMAFTYAERHKEEGCVYDYPIGGSMAIVDALARGVRKHGGKLALRSPVDQIVLDDEGKACGVRLRRGGRVVRARRAVVTNASAWDTVSALLPESASSRQRENGDETHTETTPKCGSFVHLHVGFDATGLPADDELEDSPPRRGRLAQGRGRETPQRQGHLDTDDAGPHGGLALASRPSWRTCTAPRTSRGGTGRTSSTAATSTGG